MLQFDRFHVHEHQTFLHLSRFLIHLELFTLLPYMRRDIPNCFPLRKEGFVKGPHPKSKYSSIDY